MEAGDDRMYSSDEVYGIMFDVFDLETERCGIGLGLVLTLDVVYRSSLMK